MNDLRQLARQLIARPRTVALLASSGAKPALVFARSTDLAFDMNRLVRDAAARLGGKGGGAPDFAQAGGPPASDEQVQAAIEWAYQQLDAMRQA
jgi:alanyl-tRNA synthetase